jgi:hypothetical protein
MRQYCRLIIGWQAERPKDSGNALMRTDVLVDRVAEELYPRWKEQFQEWVVGDGRCWPSNGNE